MSKIYLALFQAYEDIQEIRAFRTYKKAEDYAWKKAESDLKHRKEHYYPDEKTTVEEEFSRWKILEVELEE